MTSDDNEETLDGVAATLSLLSSPTNNSTIKNLSQRSAKMKCYHHHKHHHFLDYFNDPILYDAVIYVSDIPFQYNEREGRYAEFIGYPTGTIFVAAKKNHKFLFSQRSSTPNVSNNSYNFRQLNVNEKCSNLMQVAHVNTGDASYHTYYTWK